jgi:hypothetical protein
MHCLMGKLFHVRASILSYTEANLALLVARSFKTRAQRLLHLQQSCAA